MVIVFAESRDGEFKKLTQEAITFGHKVAAQTSTECQVLVLGKKANPDHLADFHSGKIIHVDDPAFDTTDGVIISAAITEVAEKKGAETIIMGHSTLAKAVGGRLAVMLKAGLISGANTLPGENFTVRKGVFSGKALANYRMNSKCKVITVMGNSLPVETNTGSVTIEKMQIKAAPSPVEIIEVRKTEGKVPLPEADLVVSAGRGMKGPENWKIIEDLADALNAATACSRPVADAGWRPHHEHVGQTGLAVRPNLYVAIGISGAIQHLAGVNNSKTIVVINKDSEAPFFKAADYGVCADLFDVVPMLTEAVKRFKSQ